MRNLVHHVREEDHGVAYPYHLFEEPHAVLEHAAHRFQVASDLVILQDGVVVRDMIVTEKCEDGKIRYRYYDGATYKFFADFLNRQDVTYLYLAWGDGRSAASVFDNIYLYNDTQKLRNSKLHPVIEVNGLVREVQEDLDMAWNSPRFIDPIKQAVLDAITGNQTSFHPRQQRRYKRMEYNTPEDEVPFDVGVTQRSIGIGRIKDLATRAISLGGQEDEEAMQNLRDEARLLMPGLFAPPDNSQPEIMNETDSADQETCAAAGDSCESSALGCCDGASCVYIHSVKARYCISLPS